MATTETSTIEWFELYQDILFLVMKRLNLPDFIRFAAVCTAWCSAAVDLGFPLLARVPWLISSHRGRRLFTSLDGVPTGVKLADSWTWYNLSSSKGWLISSIIPPGENGKMLNPLTGVTIVLPPANTILVRCILSSNPTEGDFMVAALPTTGEGFYLYKSCDKIWTKLTGGCYDDILFCNKRLYALRVNNLRASVKVYEFQGTDRAQLNFSVSLNSYPNALQYHRLIDSRGKVMIASAYVRSLNRFAEITTADLDGGGRVELEFLKNKRVLFLSPKSDCTSLEFSDDDDLNIISQQFDKSSRRWPGLAFSPLMVYPEKYIGIVSLNALFDKRSDDHLFMPDCKLKWRSKAIYLSDN